MLQVLLFILGMKVLLQLYLSVHFFSFKLN